MRVGIESVLNERGGRKEREHSGSLDRRVRGWRRYLKISHLDLIRIWSVPLTVLFHYIIPLLPNVSQSPTRGSVADTQSRALESIKRDYKLHLAEIVALVGLAYVIQRSGW